MLYFSVPALYSLAHTFQNCHNLHGTRYQNVFKQQLIVQVYAATYGTAAINYTTTTCRTDTWLKSRALTVLKSVCPLS
jgi:hypothetical protein